MGTKLFSEIEDIIDNIIKTQPDYNLPNEDEAIESIEQLFIKKMEGFYTWITTSDEHWKIETDKLWNDIVRAKDEVERKVPTTKEIIEIYLNK